MLAWNVGGLHSRSLHPACLVRLTSFSALLCSLPGCATDTACCDKTIAVAPTIIHCLSISTSLYYIYICIYYNTHTQLATCASTISQQLPRSKAKVLQSGTWACDIPFVLSEVARFVWKTTTAAAGPRATMKPGRRTCGFRSSFAAVTAASLERVLFWKGLFVCVSRAYRCCR